MRIPLITFLFISLSISGIGQKRDSLAVFSARFKMDSLGELGIRNHYVFTSSTYDTVFVNGQSLLGCSKEWVLKYLGKPNTDYYVGGDYDLDYPIMHDSGTTRHLLIKFDKENKVASVETIIML